MKSITLLLLVILSVNTSALDVYTSNEERADIYQSGRLGRKASLADGSTKGFFCRSVVEGGLLERMGIKAGDTIVGINDEFFPELNITNFGNTLKEDKSFILHINRKEAPALIKVEVNVFYKSNQSNKQRNTDSGDKSPTQVR